MSDRIRMMANSISRFRHAGLVFGPGWRAYDVASMSDEQREAIALYLGQFIRVHPMDEQRLQALLGKATSEPAATNENAPRDGAGEVSAEYTGMTMADLRKLADELGLDVPATVRRKADIIKLLEDETGS